MIKTLKQKRGITLIALIVTIIVLILLAGISVMMLTGNNGILQRAGEAKEKTDDASTKENISLAYNSALIDKYVKTDKTFEEKIEEELVAIYGADNVEVEDNGDETYIVTVNDKEYNIKDGKVEKNGPVVNPYEPDVWEFAWVYPTTEGTWSGKIEKNNPLPSNYKIIAKVYEGKESDVKYSLVIEGEGEIKDLAIASFNFDPDNFTPPECFAWLTGLFSSEGSLFGKEENTVKVIICDGITGIGDFAFAYCRGVKSIKISKSVTSIGDEAFVWCSFTSIKIPKGVTNIGDQAFYTCGSLTNVNIPNGVTRIGKHTFSGCTIKSIKIPNSVTSIEEQAFAGCSLLENVEIPDSVTSIGDSAFDNCASLKNVKLSSNITSIEDNVFHMCDKLQSIEIPIGVTTIGHNAFYYCSSLTNIEIPDSVTTIGKRAFCGCYGLTTTSIEIPNSVTSIGDSAFANCSSLTEIIIHKPENSIEGAKWGAPDSTEVRWIGSN